MNNMILLNPENGYRQMCSCKNCLPSLGYANEVEPSGQVIYEYRGLEEAKTAGWHYKGDAWVCPKCSTTPGGRMVDNTNTFVVNPDNVNNVQQLVEPLNLHHVTTNGDIRGLAKIKKIVTTGGKALVRAKLIK